jgi:lipoprotein-anchoring transpeptidase ErfK/SrfK
MNAISAYRRQVTVYARRRQVRLTRFRPQDRSVTPRVILHLLVGALTLVSAQAFLKPLSKSWDGAVAVSVAFAEQIAAGPTTVSAPSLSTTAVNATQSPVRIDVLTDLSTTMGRPAVPAATTWQGFAGQAANMRVEPNRNRPPVGEIRAGSPVEVVNWVAGEEVESHNNTWAELADGTYVFSTTLRRNIQTTQPTLPADAPVEGRWVDVNLTEQVATAYEGRTVVRTALVSTGRPGWETPTGAFSILRRVEKDTMDGATLIGQGPNGTGATYKVEDVRHVQYFTSDGAAIHENYWRRPANFGMPGSHGCIGMVPSDAAWFWEWAEVGTPLVIHE